jgi:hypothetical protein
MGAIAALFTTVKGGELVAFLSFVMMILLDIELLIDHFADKNETCLRLARCFRFLLSNLSRSSCRLPYSIVRHLCLNIHFSDSHYHCLQLVFCAAKSKAKKPKESRNSSFPYDFHCIPHLQHYCFLRFAPLSPSPGNLKNLWLDTNIRNS